MNLPGRIFGGYKPYTKNRFQVFLYKKLQLFLNCSCLSRNLYSNARRNTEKFYVGHV